MFKFGVKSAVLGTAVYYSIEKGVWKDSETTAALYEELEQGLSPYVGQIKAQVPYELPPLPSNDRLSYLFKYYWNSGVKSTFRFLIDLPTHTNEAVNKAYGLVFATLEAEDQSQKTSKEGDSK